ncbi:alpha/beta fold hydrolase [Cupriavidus basilensis]
MAAVTTFGASDANAAGNAGASHHSAGSKKSNLHHTKDGTQIFYKDWGSGRPAVSSSVHGWPLNRRRVDAQMLFLVQKGFRVIAHDRRGHGRSGPACLPRATTWTPTPDDLAALLDALDIQGATLVGHSTGGGEVAHYIGRHGTKRVAQAAVLIGAVPPTMAQDAPRTPERPADGRVRRHPQGRGRNNRSQFYNATSTTPFFGFNRPGAKVSQGTIDAFWAQGMTGAASLASTLCIKEFSRSTTPRT